MTKYSKSVEDYLEAIYILTLGKGYARGKDIAKFLKVSSPSVTEMLLKLNGEGLVTYERYAPVILTKKGSDVAKSIKNRHDTLTQFFKFLLVEPKIASTDACELEHDISSVSLIQLTKFVEYLNLVENKSFIDQFREYSSKN